MSIRSTLGLLSCALVLLLTCAGLSFAQDDVGPAVALADAKTKTGAFKVTLTARSPLSALKDIGKRTGIKPADLGADYDLASEVFYVYVPKDPGDGGKYGLMVGLCFKEYGFPATAWPEVLEKKHLIWIGAANNGDDRAAAQRIGLLLDAVSNARATWPIDSDRVYLSMNAMKGPALGTAYYYPEVFTGLLGSAYPHWFMKLNGFEHPPSTWSTDDFPRPAGKQLELAKSNTRIFQADRDEGSSTMGTQMEVIQKRGFGPAGFKYIKFIKVPEANMGHYVNYSADWFEQGIDFMDQPLDKIRAARQPHAKPKVNPLKPIAGD